MPRVDKREWKLSKEMETLRLTVDPSALHTPEAAHAIETAAAILRAGGLVALPTETVYGLGANALDAAAVERIFAAKRRPAWDPIIAHIADHGTGDRTSAMLDVLAAEIPEPARRLMQTFWPGPLTLLLPRSADVPDAVTAGRPLVGVRMPAHPVALEVIRSAGVPVAAPSANLFSHISPTTAAHVLHDLDGRIDAVLDAGPTLHGVESTVLDPCSSPMTIYRPGAITLDQIRAVAGPVVLFQETAAPAVEPGAGLPAPGVGLRHYAPRARLVTVEAALPQLTAHIQQAVLLAPGERIGIMLPDEIPAPAGVPPHLVYRWGRWDAPEELAANLYAGLRKLDAEGCTVIVCPLPPEPGIGAAIRDRLTKAGRGATGPDT